MTTKEGVKTINWPQTLKRAQQLAFEISPDYATARAFIDLVEKDCRTLDTHNKTIQLLYGIIDGIKYGNWPKE